MKYSIYILPTAEKDCNRLSKEAYSRCKKAILRLEGSPRPLGCKKLVGEDGYRIRVGDYRVLYRVDDRLRQIFVYRIKHRREIYR